MLVDTGPDLREQLLDAGVGRVDARDLDPRPCRPLPRHRRSAASSATPAAGRCRAMPAPTTLDALAARFAYAFDGKRGLSAGGRPRTHRPSDIDARATAQLRFVDQPHGGITSPACASTRAANRSVYATDFHDLTDDMATLYEGVDLWIVDCLRRRPHPTHPHLDAVLGWARELQRRRSYADPSWTTAWTIAPGAPSCPTGRRPAYDGQEIVLVTNDVDARRPLSADGDDAGARRADRRAASRSPSC